MRLTPLDIIQHQFKTSFRGFDVQEVDAFLGDVADAFQLLLNEIEKLKSDMDRLNHDIKEYAQREETFKIALLNSQSVMKQMKENAQKAAEVIIADAEVKAEKIISRANNRLVRLQDEISELKRQRLQMETQISSVIESYSRLLEMSRDEQKTIDDNELKIKLMKQPT
ncbi:MAG: DivIVA domain-containing protein [Desulfobacteraceae bacterium]|nr:MAG: DivIVA domain-containing protein [Desulfobacteraceae bacterium]